MERTQGFTVIKCLPRVECYTRSFMSMTSLDPPSVISFICSPDECLLLTYYVPGSVLDPEI